MIRGNRTELLILRALSYLVEQERLRSGDGPCEKNRVLALELTSEADRVSRIMRSEDEARNNNDGSGDGT